MKTHKRMDQEFKIGDHVTFNAYGMPLKATVRSVKWINAWGKHDGRVFYGIEGKNIVSHTTARSIEESKYFVLPAFKNAQYKDDGATCIHVTHCRARTIEQARKIMPIEWEVCHEEDISTKQKLWRQGDVEFYGKL